MDYWWNIYGIGICKPEDAAAVEFSVTDDEEGENRFFHFDLLNLPCLEEMITTGECVKKDDPDYDLFLHRYSTLKNGEVDYFIGYLFYPAEKHGEGYSFYSFKHLNEHSLSGKSIFEIKNKKNEPPYYVSVFVNEADALTTEKIIEWTKKLSQKMFLTTFDLQLAGIPDKNEALLCYQETMKHMKRQ
jgi:hypothetical protein